MSDIMNTNEWLEVITRLRTGPNDHVYVFPRPPWAPNSDDLYPSPDISSPTNLVLSRYSDPIPSIDKVLYCDGEIYRQCCAARERYGDYVRMASSKLFSAPQRINKNNRETTSTYQYTRDYKHHGSPSHNQPIIGATTPDNIDRQTCATITPPMTTINAATTKLSKAVDKVHELTWPLSPHSAAVDLCSAPGSMTQWLYNRAGPTNLIISTSKTFAVITKRVFATLAGSQRQGDGRNTPAFTYFEKDLLGGRGPTNSRAEALGYHTTIVKHIKDVARGIPILNVVADGADDMTHDKLVPESARNYGLINAEIEIALAVLDDGGRLLIKMFDIVNERYYSLIWKTFRCFDRAVVFKTQYSASRNSEKYIWFYGFSTIRWQELKDAATHRRSTTTNEGGVSAITEFERRRFIPFYYNVNNNFLTSQIKALYDIMTMSLAGY